MSTLSKCLCAIALIQNDTPTSKTKPLLDKRNPRKCRLYRYLSAIYNFLK